MNKDYKIIIPQILSNLNPKIGVIRHQINYSNPLDSLIDYIQIEVKQESFEYVDPFYGKIKSLNPIEFFIQLWTEHENLEIKTWKDFENLKLMNFKECVGCFSNSIDIVPISLEMGRISNHVIDCAIEFYLSNSESYACMTGEKVDHSEFTSTVNLNLEIAPMELLIDDSTKSKKVVEALSSDYDVKNMIKIDKFTWKDSEEIYHLQLKKNYA